MTSRFILFLFALSVIVIAACKTQFYGEPKVPGGAEGCSEKCSELGMALAGMVVMGDYSDGCICAVRGAARGSAFLYVAANGAAASAAAIATQIEDEEAAQQDAQSR